MTPTHTRTGSAFKQQRLKAWQPILTPRTVLPAFFAIGIAFVPIGIGLFISSNQACREAPPPAAASVTCPVASCTC